MAFSPASPAARGMYRGDPGKVGFLEVFARHGVGGVVWRLVVGSVWVRPYLVENTTSRPICEVKQLQA